MANEAADGRPRAGARFELSDLLPDGVNQMPMEREGEFVWLVRHGYMRPELVAELNAELGHIVGNGLWEQKWSGPCPPPHPEEDS
ncbi:hypothetical protein AB0K71_06130 [Streptomyces syringium]|uniref:hypothetical protein n=1 Tax=Streptomyces syringium TaxID=76729 RepID=UPI00341F8C0D